MAIFTVDWEHVNSFKPFSEWSKEKPLVDEPTEYLLDLLRRHKIKAIFYVVGFLRFSRPILFSQIVKEGHVIGDHTWSHDVNDDQPRFLPYRAPRWEGQKRLYSGGFWFRAMPYWWVKREVEKTRIFFIHPHDVIQEHPDCGSRLKTFERRLGLKTSRDKLERLCREVKWDEPR